MFISQERAKLGSRVSGTQSWHHGACRDREAVERRAVRAGSGGGEGVTTVPLMTGRLTSYHHFRRYPRGNLFGTLFGCAFESATTTMAGLSRVSLVSTALYIVLFLASGVIGKSDNGSRNHTCPSGHVQWYSQCFQENPCECFYAFDVRRRELGLTETRLQAKPTQASCMFATQTVSIMSCFRVLPSP